VDRILIVDDERGMRDLLSIMLRNDGYRVESGRVFLPSPGAPLSGLLRRLVISDIAHARTGAASTCFASPRKHSPTPS